MPADRSASSAENIPEPHRPDHDAADSESYSQVETSSQGDISGSDVAPADEAAGTVQAPSFRPPASPKPERSVGPISLEPGDRIGDFEIASVLGRGAFGVVYLARQLSLDRQVALKVAANQGSEGRTMARLEHRHIVQVFSESVTSSGNQRLLCMQLVPGTSLQNLIQEIRQRSDDEYHWQGSNLLKILDGLANLPAVLDPSALHDREALARMDDVEATAWIGARLGEALDFAHHQGVLHRDIKPANILMNQYGQPKLADFNISQLGRGDEAEGQFGGTLPYMAPEHLDAFNPEVVVMQEAVTEKSDIYSLGIVLYELFTGRLPFARRKLAGNLAQRVTQLSNERRQYEPVCPPGRSDSRKVLQQTIGQCLEPEPEDRYAGGAELAEALDGCRRLRQAEGELPQPGAITRSALQWPMLWLALFALLPHAAGSVVNIWYNNQQIVQKLTAEQQQLFVRLVLGYNLVVYPLALVAAGWIAYPVWSTWRAMNGDAPVDPLRVDSARVKAARLPIWAAVLAAIGWLPGGVLFPTAIDLFSGHAGAWVYGHFLASFTLSGMIALAYSYCGAHYIVLRVLYPAMWRNPARFHERARQELTWMPLRHYLISLFAGSIPLLAAVTLIVAGSDAGRGYQWLIGTLIVLGLLGYEVARAATQRLSQTLVALTGPEVTG